MSMFKVIQGNTVSEVIRLANANGITKEEYVQLLINDGSVILVYYQEYE